MYVKKLYGYVLSGEEKKSILKGLLDTYDPPTQRSANWK